MTLFSQRPKKSPTPQKSSEDFFGVQAKLSIGKSNDKYEVEADKVADTVVAKKQNNNADTFFNPSPIVQKKQAKEIQKQEETEIQEKPLVQSITPVVQLASAEEEPVQMRSNNEAQTDSSSGIENKLSSSKNGGSPLQESTKTEMESGFGTDFSNVRVHQDTNAVQMNKELGSQAFANGNNIYFNEGKYNPNSQDGKHLLAHELTHTVQQGASKPSVQKKETPDVAKTKPTAATETQTPVKSESESKNTAKPTAENKAPNPVENANSIPAKQEEKGSENESATPSSVASNASANPSAAAPNNSTTTTTQEIPAVEEKTVEEAPKTDEKATEIPAEDKKGEEIAEGPSIERDPKANPAFQNVVAGIGKTAKQQKDNDPAEKLSADAQAAAPSPSNERDSQAQANQVDEMEAQEPQVFSAEAFKAQLMARIAEMQLPKNNEEADEFEENNNIDEVNKNATEDVKKEKAAAAGPIDKTTNKEPNTGAVPQRTEVPLPPLKEAPKPGSVGATKAIPDKRPDAEVVKPIEEDTARMDQTMTENKVTDEQLEKSEEPTFQEALGKKNEAKTTAQAAPVSLREQENAALQKNASTAENASQKELEGMNLLRGTALQGVGTTQADSGSKDTSERQRIADEINAIYEETKTDVTNILDTLETTVTDKFEAEAETAKGKFETYVDQKMSLYKARRYSGITGGLQWGYDLFAGLPDEVNIFFTEGREVFVNHMDGAITVIANIVATELTNAKNRIEIGKQKVTDYVNELPTNQKKFGEEAASDIQDKFDSLKDDVNSKQDSLVDSLAQQYSDNIGEVDARIEEMKAANKGLIDAAIGFINGIIETIKKLRDLVSSLLSAIASVIEVIIAAPIEFMGNLFKGIGQGIDLFKANIQKHLLGGLLEWLTGSLGPMGITVPDDIFSLSGIFNLLMQVLGLGWDQIRMKAVKIMGEPTVKVLETGYDMFKTFATKGIDGIWEYLQESFADLKETVIDAIKNMLITQVIEAGIKWLLSLLIPGAGFIKAIMAIKDVIVFFVESAIMLIPAIIEGILALAAGSVAGVAKAIEFGLAKLIPLVIGLFAKLIGLGGLSKKVMKIFTNIRKRIDKVIMKLLMKAKAAGRKLLGKLGLGSKEKPKNKEQHDDQVKEGMKYLHQQEKALDSDSDKAISQEEANKVAAKTKKKFKVFDSITPRKVGTKWVYDWKGSNGTEDGAKVDVENEGTPKEILKQNQKVVHNSALNTVEKSVDKIAKDEEKKKGNEKIKSWSGLQKKIEETSPASKLHIKPITNSDDYGKHTKGQVNAAADKVLVDKKAAEKKEAIKSKIADIENKPSALAFVSLRNQILDNSKESEANERLEASFKGEEPDHDKFIPIITNTVTKGDKTTITYNYKGGSEVFTVTFNNQNNETHQVIADNISFHTFGRGVTQGDTKEDLNRAHIVGNEVRGTGYIEGHNLMLTSDTFNQKTMRDQERAISKYLNGLGELKNGVSTFNMSVNVERFDDNEKIDVAGLRSSFAKRKSELEADVSKMTDEKKAESKRYKEYQTLEALLNKSDADLLNEVEKNTKTKGERRVKNVIYVITKIKFGNNTEIEPKEKFETGPDNFLGTK